MPKTDTTKIPRPIKRGYKKTEYAENCPLCMYSHNGTCGFDYCHVAYSKALRRYDAVIGLPRYTGHYNIGTPSRDDTRSSRANKKDI